MNDKVGPWLPARKEGKTVEAELQLPVKFVLDRSIPKADTLPASPGSDEKIEPYTYVEEMPRYNGCEDILDPSERFKCTMSKLFEFVYENIKYPAEDKEDRIEGQGIVQFVVEADGRLSDIRVIRSPSPTITAEMMRMMNVMAGIPDAWLPGKHNGVTVPVKFTLPIKFKLKDDAPKNANPGNIPTKSDRIGPISVMPNPASERISFDIFQDTHTIKIFDSMSKQVISYGVEKGNSKRQSVDISSLIPGSYVVQLISDTNTTSLAFIIVR
jgi:TonB family protein